MKITIAKSDLSRALDIAQRAVPTATMPIITCVLLQAEGETLTIVATNLDMGLVLRCPADVTEPGTVAVPAKVFRRLVSSVVGDVVRIESSETFIALECGRNKTKLQTQDADDFPPLPKAPAEPDIVLHAWMLKSALGRVLHAVAQDDVWPVLAGVLFDVRYGSLTVVAADGYQLAQARLFTETAYPDEVSVIVPGRTVRELVRLLADDEDVGFSLVENQQHLIIRGDNWELSSRLVAGKYPNYEQRIPERYMTRIEIDRRELMAALRAVRVVADQSQGHVRFKAGNGRLILSALSSDVGEASEAIEATITANGSDALGEFGLNGQMLSGILAALPGDRVTVDGTAPDSPFVWRPVSGDDCLMVQMPMYSAGR